MRNQSRQKVVHTETGTFSAKGQAAAKFRFSYQRDPRMAALSGKP